MTAPTPPDADTIRRLVVEVIARLQAGVPAAPPASPAASPPGQPTATAGIALADKVITLASLERLPAGTRRVAVTAAAVITPSAREFAADAGIELVRGGEATQPSATRRPFIVASVECGGDAAGHCAAIVRGIPGAQQLPATGLADVIGALATHASRDGARGVLLSSRPSAAVVLANRSASLRAVTARDVAGLLAASSECAANLLVVDPRVLSAVSLERVASDFARRDPSEAPAELAAPSSSCSCKGHAH
ncbi:MAG: hypothetical protein ACKOEX_10170 [Planctomycetia bacterium]